MAKYESIGNGIVKRTERRVIGLFIDGVGLDRASRRLERRVDLQALVRGVTSGLTPVVARYYTLIPHEDDSRHHAFLDAVARAGLQVVVKRLPPKNVNRQVLVDVEMAADILAFTMGHQNFGALSLYQAGSPLIEPGQQTRDAQRPPMAAATDEAGATEALRPELRVVTVVCPSKDLSYPLSLARELGADTVNADFGKGMSGDVLKSAAKWIDLSTSTTIWKPEVKRIDRGAQAANSGE